MERETTLRFRVKVFTWIFILGLAFSGVTAIPVRREAQALSKALGLPATETAPPASPVAAWIVRVRDALNRTETTAPFLFYGTDWLAFGHFVIAIAFFGALLDPVRNRWLFDFGIIACALVIPYALAFGALRGIPMWWRLVDCSFGVFGFIPLWFCRKWTRELENAAQLKSAS